MKKPIFVMLFVFAVFVTSSCEKTDVNNEIGFDINATDKPDSSSPGSGEDNEDDDPY